MFKNLSMWMFNKSPDGEQAKQDVGLLRAVLMTSLSAKELIEDHPPANPAFGQLRASGLLPLDDLIVEQCTDPKVINTFLPLTQVIRERVIDNGAVKFEVAQRVAHIRVMEGRVCGRKEIQAIKDEVIHGMMTDAPIREKRVFGIVTSMGKILVGATGKAAEDYIGYIKSLFGAGYIPMWQATISDWNGDSANFTEHLLSSFARKLIHDAINDVDECPFMSAGSFQFSGAKEKFAVVSASDSTIQDLLERIEASYVDWIELAHDHATFKLYSDLTLKSIKLHDLDYEPENNEEVGLSAAYHRFYMNFFLHLFDSLVREVVKVNGGDDV